MSLPTTLQLSNGFQDKEYFPKSKDEIPRHLEQMVYPEIDSGAVCQKDLLVHSCVGALFCRLCLFIGGVGERCGNHRFYQYKLYVCNKSLKWRYHGESNKPAVNSSLFKVFNKRAPAPGH
jgi:hypothetical protein